MAFNAEDGRISIERLKKRGWNQSPGSSHACFISLETSNNLTLVNQPGFTLQERSMRRQTRKRKVNMPEANRFSRMIYDLFKLFASNLNPDGESLFMPRAPSVFWRSLVLSIADVIELPVRTEISP
jgi:hypothetical protein